MCFKQFKAIVSSHSHLLDLLESSRKGYGGECHSHTMQYIVFSCSCTESYELYTERDVWACIQQVVSGKSFSTFHTFVAVLPQLRSILEVYLAVDEDKGPQTAMSSYSPFMIGGWVLTTPA